MASGLTIAEMVLELKIKPDTIKRRLQRLGIKATAYAGPTALYDPAVIKKIREVAPVGRPPVKSGKAREKK